MTTTFVDGIVKANIANRAEQFARYAALMQAGSRAGKLSKDQQSELGELIEALGFDNARVQADAKAIEDHVKLFEQLADPRYVGLTEQIAATTKERQEAEKAFEAARLRVAELRGKQVQLDARVRTRGEWLSRMEELTKKHEVLTKG